MLLLFASANSSLAFELPRLAVAICKKTLNKNLQIYAKTQVSAKPEIGPKQQDKDSAKLHQLNWKPTT